MAKLFSIQTAVLVGVLVAVWFVFDSTKEKFYVFDQNRLHEIVTSVLAEKPPSTEVLIENLVAKLNESYPGHLNLNTKVSFFFCSWLSSHRNGCSIMLEVLWVQCILYTHQLPNT
jgi:hypothetical protein